VRAGPRVAQPRAFVLGGNASTLAFVQSFAPQRGGIVAHLVPLAQTPVGTVLGETWQRVTIAAENLVDWIDQTFSPEDERAFVASLRDIELLMRVEWSAEPPEVLEETIVLNADDLPGDVAEALAHPPEPLVQCATCRRLCVRDQFVWKERQLCAWDYHLAVFGPRGPWHNGPYEERHLETLPRAAYVAPPLLEPAGAAVVLATAGLDDDAALGAIAALLARYPAIPHIAVRTDEGYTLVRERPE
jgi:hypothetical protein